MQITTAHVLNIFISAVPRSSPLGGPFSEPPGHHLLYQALTFSYLPSLSPQPPFHVSLSPLTPLLHRATFLGIRWTRLEIYVLTSSAFCRSSLVRYARLLTFSLSFFLHPTPPHSPHPAPAVALPSATAVYPRVARLCIVVPCFIVLKNNIRKRKATETPVNPCHRFPKRTPSSYGKPEFPPPNLPLLLCCSLPPARSLQSLLSYHSTPSFKGLRGFREYFSFFQDSIVRTDLSRIESPLQHRRATGLKVGFGPQLRRVVYLAFEFRADRILPELSKAAVNQF